MSAFWGSLSSLLIGVSDLLLVRVNHRMSIITLMIAAMLGGIGAALVVVPFVDSSLHARSMLLGALAGLSMGVALAVYIKSLTLTSVSVTSPATAVQVALWPFVYDIVAEDARPGGVAYAGVVVALVSLVFTTWSPESVGRLWAGMRLALLSGALYGIGNILLGSTDEAAGLWPAVTHRSAGFVMFVVAAVVLGIPRVPPSGTRMVAVLGGAVGTLAIGAYVIGTQRGSLGLVAVTGSLFPAASVTLLHRYAGHPLRWWQGVGVGGAIAGAALIAVA